MTPAQITEEQREALEALARARDTAMHQTLAADIPACGAFGAIAQDLDFALPIISAAEARGYARGVEDAERFRHDVLAELQKRLGSALAWQDGTDPKDVDWMRFDGAARECKAVAEFVRALSPSPAQKEE